MSAPRDQAAACVLEDIAHRLHSARALLLDSPDAGAAAWGALALIAEAGDLADRALRALGGFPVAGTLGEWRYTRSTLEALAQLEAAASREQGGAA